jgi:predicted DNA-binding transcriptional regulator AlpA
MGDQSTPQRPRQSVERVLRHLRYVAQITRDMITDLAEFERQLGSSIEELELTKEHVKWADNQLMDPTVATVEPRVSLTERYLVNDLMTQLQVAKALSVSRTTLWKMRKEGRLPPQIQVSNRRVAFRRVDVEDWIQRGGTISE